MCVCVSVCQYSLSVSRYWAEAARYLADSLILPLSSTSYAAALTDMVDQLDRDHGPLMRANGLTLGLAADCLFVFVFVLGQLLVFLSDLAVLLF